MNRDRSGISYDRVCQDLGAGDLEHNYIIIRVPPTRPWWTWRFLRNRLNTALGDSVCPSNSSTLPLQIIRLILNDSSLESKCPRIKLIMPIPLLPLFAAAEQHARQDPDKIAVVDATKQQSFTFVQLLADAAALRKRIIEQLRLTDDLEERRIAFLVPNGYDYVATQWAVWAAGGVCVPLCR